MNDGWAPSIARDTVLVVVDVQEVFAQQTPWQVPELASILPAIQALAQAFERRRIFTRFLYQDPDCWPGDAWRAYYHRWSFFKERPDLAEIVAQLRPVAATVVDKPTYSCLTAPSFMPAVRELGGRRLVFAGVETDICVLASVFGAIEEGLPYAVVADACASSSSTAHEAALEILRRLPDQVDLLRAHDLIVSSPGASRGQA